MSSLSAYARVSTTTQEAGFGIAIQHELMSKWARANTHRIIRFHDDTESGSEGVDNRPGLANCIADIAEGITSGIVVARLDRLARDVILQETLFAEFAKYGARVYSCQGGEDAYLRDEPDDPSRKMIRVILGAVAEYERGVISLRMEAGRALRRSTGGWAGGTTPYGWRSSRGTLVPEPVEQEQIALMRTLRGRGPRRGGMGYPTIARTLNEIGVPTRKGTGTWQSEQVRRILERKARKKAKGAPGEGLRDDIAS